MSMTSRAVTVRVALGAVLLIAVLGGVVGLIHGRGGLSQQDEITARWVVDNHVATRAEYLKTVHLRDTLVDPDHRYVLTEQDVDWLLAFADDPRFRGHDRALRKMYACNVLVPAGRARLPRTRLAAMYAFGVSLVHTPEDDEDKSDWSGCRILGSLGDTRAIPEITPLLSSRSKATRQFAANALDDLGVDMPPPT